MDTKWDTSLAEEYSALWDGASPAPDPFDFLRRHPDASAAQIGALLLADQRERHRVGGAWPVEHYWTLLPDSMKSQNLRLALAVEEFKRSFAVFDRHDITVFAARFADLKDELEMRLAADLGPRRSAGAPSSDPVTTMFIPDSQRRPLASDTPARIGRYPVQRKLGQGGYGAVFLAKDVELEREVAIKIWHPGRDADPASDGSLNEARTLALLDHPAIVPVYDVGRLDDGACYIVSKYVEGTDLFSRIKQGRLSQNEAARHLIVIAEALHYAHERGLVHRDVKPANILIDLNGAVHLIDFGVALRDQNGLESDFIVGTPAYMSPEQARGESHLVDGRSDIFSLGVVMYELLTGQRPFEGNSVEQTLELIELKDPRPPRQLDNSIAPELERICLKALSKRVRDRYTIAHDLTDDLKCFLEPAESVSDSAIRVLPKGLRSFDSNDADFFLGLLPGPRNRDGLPESLRIWKNRIEKNESVIPFRVGLIYGPSWCGKSSFVKAGLLPRLDSSVNSVYIECSGDETELRLALAAGRSLDRDVSPSLLVEFLGQVRRGQGLEPGQKLLIVLDQFEQWLHSHSGEAQTQLGDALRQCDGDRVQCLILVRDDFWLSASRFMASLEIDLEQSRNLGLVDLFDEGHAIKVLEAFGRAYGRLPEPPAELAPDQQSFLSNAIRELQDGGYVVPVRLALFAEMLKDRPWSPAQLKRVGGSRGVGLRFLEETISSRRANPRLRQHQEAVRRVLDALLPETGSDIKGGMKSFEELVRCAGYENNVGEFRRLIHVLDADVRLITPVDFEGPVSSGIEATPTRRFYQLTHDYLVQAVRDWLVQKQQATREGRAMLRLKEQSKLWNALPQYRYLPDTWEWGNILLFTKRQSWSEPQKRMMRATNRFHTLRLCTVIFMIVLSVILFRETRGHILARSAVRQTVQSDIQSLPDNLREIKSLERWAIPEFRAIAAEFAATTQNGLMARLALARSDPTYVKETIATILKAAPSDIRVLHELIHPHAAMAAPPLRQILIDYQRPKRLRIRAAAALANFDPDSKIWSQVGSDVAAWLAQENTVALGDWIGLFRPIASHLQPSLYRRFTQPEQPEIQLAAAIILAEYAGASPDVLADLVMRSTPAQMRQFLPALGRSAMECAPALKAIFRPAAAATSGEKDGDEYAKMQANLALALLEIGEESLVWPLLRSQPDQRLRFQFIHRAASCGVSPEPLLHRLQSESDASVRRALLLAIAEYAPESLPVEGKAGLRMQLEQLYETDSDAGIHSITEWLLKQRGFGDPKAQRKIPPTHVDLDREMGWFVDRNGMTFAVFRGRSEFMMGTAQPPERFSELEKRHRRIIPRTFAMTTTEVTAEAFREFKPTGGKLPMIDIPATGVSLDDAMGFCRWLSEKAGIPESQMCYQKSASKNGRVTPYSDYLTRTGYRLPTEGEWEFACRGGVETTHLTGRDMELLTRYAWFYPNDDHVVHPVATLRPNDFGMFDMLGNASEWCQDNYVSYAKLINDGSVVDLGPVSESGQKVLRGSRGNGPDSMRFGKRNGVNGTGFGDTGFRIAKTIRSH